MIMKANSLARLWGRALAALPAVACLAACSLVKEELAECPVPVTEIRFVYEYNMERANAFHNQVDCLTAYFFDDNGQLADIQYVNDPTTLADEEYRMKPQLKPGNYHLVAYGGMACDFASFGHPDQPKIGDPLTALRVQLDPIVYNPDTPDNQRRLHNHFFGSADFTVEPDIDTKAKVEMMRNTNSIQIALQQEAQGQSIDVNDFTFEITDDNNDFDHLNNLIPSGLITYKPWNTENRSTGTVDSNNDNAHTRRIHDSRADEEVTDNDEDATEYHAALAQFHVSRLVKNKAASTYLHIKRADDGSTVLRVPLINYMLMFKNDATSNAAQYYQNENVYYMGDQEYLDRANSWNFVFFLSGGGLWIKSHIKVNDWDVRLNDIEM